MCRGSRSCFSVPRTLYHSSALAFLSVSEAQKGRKGTLGMKLWEWHERCTASQGQGMLDGMPSRLLRGTAGWHSPPSPVCTQRCVLPGILRAAPPAPWSSRYSGKEPTAPTHTERCNLSMFACRPLKPLAKYSTPSGWFVPIKCHHDEGERKSVKTQHEKAYENALSLI